MRRSPPDAGVVMADRRPPTANPACHVEGDCTPIGEWSILMPEIGAMREYITKPKIANAEETMSSPFIGTFPQLPGTEYPAQTPTIDIAVPSSARLRQRKP